MLLDQYHTRYDGSYQTPSGSESLHINCLLSMDSLCSHTKTLKFPVKRGCHNWYSWLHSIQSSNLRNHSQRAALITHTTQHGSLQSPQCTLTTIHSMGWGRLWWTRGVLPGWSYIIKVKLMKQSILMKSAGSLAAPGNGQWYLLPSPSTH